MRKGNARDRILDAAEALIAREGVMRLTLDGVAAEAKVSKGGLLYHFPSKEALVVGMVGRLVDEFETAHAQAVAKDGKPPGQWSRAYLTATLASPGDGSRVGALLAAVATEPELLKPLRERYKVWQKALEGDGLDAVDATLVRLAADGLWIADILGLPPLAPRLHQRVVERLRRLTEGPGVGP